MDRETDRARERERRGKDRKRERERERAEGGIEKEREKKRERERERDRKREIYWIGTINFNELRGKLWVKGETIKRWRRVSKLEDTRHLTFGFFPRRVRF